ncbi:MAG TPA: LpqN/LpqT family lipoprotein [Mycobacterium sp.]|nr:LpqN/LpqT family lipoprotein [Mycobacterium sp.]HTX98114.1 LpqN/LpqT family lipoprotein [Mycobacterium sp.]
MKKLTAVTVVGITAVALGVAMVGCGSNAKTETKTSTSTSTSITTTAPTTSDQAAGPNKTIQDYIKENQIVETPVHRGDPGSPNINLPTPPGWSDAGPSTPARAYTALVYDQPNVPDDPPRITAVVSKLTGNVDPAQILNYAPGQLKNLPGFEGLDSGSKSTMSGFDAFQMAGYYMKDGTKRVRGQKTVVIPGQDCVYVLQLTADGPDGSLNTIMDATKVIDPQTTITF